MEYGKTKLIRLLSNTPREGWTNQKIKDLIDSLWRDPVLLRWSGFENAGGIDTLITWDAEDKIFSIAPLLVTFGFYQYRVKLSFHKRALIESLNMTEHLAEGRYIFFYSYDETLLKHVVSFIHNPTETEINEIFLYKTEIANLYWDADAGEALHFGDDRHGSEWNPQIHRYLHTAFRARRKSGLTITGASFGGDGSDNAHAKFSVVGGVMLHDDFELTIPSSSDSIPILYKSGFVPRYVYNSGYAIYKGAARACYNTGGAIIQAASGNFVLYHIFATNEILTASRKIISVMGSAEYTSLADAYSAAPAELDALNAWMPQQGRLHIDTIVVRTDDAYANDPASIIVGVIGETHPPVTIADDTKELLSITEKQELSIPGEFEADEFYGIKNRIWQKITAGGGGTDGRGIISIVLTSTVGLTKTYTITYTDATTDTFTIQDGSPGANGRGIASIVLHATVGLVKTYRITYTDATIFNYDVKDGANGASAYIYIAWADTDGGTGFTTLFDAAKNYIAILNTTAPLLSPGVGDFAGLWKKYKGEDGSGGTSVTQVTGLTLVVANWVTDGSLKKYVLSNASITSTSSVEVIPSRTVHDALKIAEPMEETESASGSVTIWFKNVPTVDIPVTINITEIA